MAILDADKEGFLRSETALIQTIGRAARNVNGKVIMYADTITRSMQRAIDETNRRRAKQLRYNQEHGIVPVSIVKSIRDLTDRISPQARERSLAAVAEKRAEYHARREKAGTRAELEQLIRELEREMKEAARNLEFERAAALRDELFELKALLADQPDLKPWERVHLLAGEEG